MSQSLDKAIKCAELRTKFYQWTECLESLKAGKKPTIKKQEPQDIYDKQRRYFENVPRILNELFKTGPCGKKEPLAGQRDKKVKEKSPESVASSEGEKTETESEDEDESENTDKEEDKKSEKKGKKEKESDNNADDDGDDDDDDGDGSDAGGAADPKPSREKNEEKQVKNKKKKKKKPASSDSEDEGCSEAGEKTYRTSKSKSSANKCKCNYLPQKSIDCQKIGVQAFARNLRSSQRPGPSNDSERRPSCSTGGSWLKERELKFENCLAQRAPSRSENFNRAHDQVFANKTNVGEFVRSQNNQKPNCRPSTPFHVSFHSQQLPSNNYPIPSPSSYYRTPDTYPQSDCCYTPPSSTRRRQQTAPSGFPPSPSRDSIRCRMAYSKNNFESRPPMQPATPRLKTCSSRGSSNRNMSLASCLQFNNNANKKKDGNPCEDPDQTKIHPSRPRGGFRPCYGGDFYWMHGYFDCNDNLLSKCCPTLKNGKPIKKGKDKEKGKEKESMCPCCPGDICELMSKIIQLNDNINSAANRINNVQCKLNCMRQQNCCPQKCPSKCPPGASQKVCGPSCPRPGCTPCKNNSCGPSHCCPSPRRRCGLPPPPSCSFIDPPYCPMPLQSYCPMPPQSYCPMPPQSYYPMPPQSYCSMPPPSYCPMPSRSYCSSRPGCCFPKLLPKIPVITEMPKNMLASS